MDSKDTKAKGTRNVVYASSGKALSEAFKKAYKNNEKLLEELKKY